jgi:hypothetical protein
MLTLPARDKYPLAEFNKEVIFHSLLVNWGNITSDAIIDSSLYASYGMNDLRRTAFFDSSGTLFRGSYYGGKLLFSGLATDEMYLTRAECNARNGHITAAMDDLDTLLTYRYHTGAFVPVTASGTTDAIVKVLQERRKELLLRGLRWSDLRRLNRDSNFAVTITRTINGQTYTLTPNSFRYVFPVPDDVLQLSGIAQNPGW